MVMDRGSALPMVDRDVNNSKNSSVDWEYQHLHVRDSKNSSSGNLLYVRSVGIADEWEVRKKTGTIFACKTENPFIRYLCGKQRSFFLVSFLMYKSTSMLCLWNKGVFSSFVSFFDVIDFSYFFSKCTSVATLFNLIRHYRLAEGSPSQFERQDNADWIFRWCQFQNHY